jgi:hypothetical protein
VAAARLLAAVVSAGLIAGCQADRPFKTAAVYETADRGCTMQLETRGVVRAGDDLARDAEGRITLSSATHARGAPPLNAVVVLRAGDLTIDGAVGAENDTLLAADLAAVGCSPTADERAELRRAIEGALVGPKGTLMAGQAKTVRVVSVHFDSR